MTDGGRKSSVGYRFLNSPGRLEDDQRTRSALDFETIPVTMARALLA